MPLMRHPAIPILTLLARRAAGHLWRYTEINTSNLDVWMKSVLVEQNRTSINVSHGSDVSRTHGQDINGFLQGDDVSLPRNVFFDSSFFTASRSWVQQIVVLQVKS